jgi:hypothetical protein
VRGAKIAGLAEAEVLPGLNQIDVLRVGQKVSRTILRTVVDDDAPPDVAFPERTNALDTSLQLLAGIPVHDDDVSFHFLFQLCLERSRK